MTDKLALLQFIAEDWRGNPQQVAICQKIVEHASTPGMVHITQGSLRQLLGSDVQDSDILIAIQYLTGGRAHALEVRFELITGDDDIRPISNEAVRQAIEIGALVDPDTGHLIDDYEDKVFVYYEPAANVPVT